jgi:hypothetical protein
MSEVEIVTLEPEVIKKLIEKISKSGGIPTVQDLEIRDNSIFFLRRNWYSYWHTRLLSCGTSSG